MKQLAKIFSITAAAAVLLSGCIKEIVPQGGKASFDQANEAEGSYDNFVAAITNSLAGSFAYRPASQWPIDYGYPSFFLSRDVMGQDITLEEQDWYVTQYGCGTSLGPSYALAQVPWTYYFMWVKSCNIVLEMAGDEPSAERRSGAGIAHAMRAMFYMDLARMYAPKSYAKDPNAQTVPWVGNDTQLSELPTTPRLTNEQMWGKILEDLDKAEQYLADYKRPNVYTPDLSVVYGLKARAYLTMEKWKEAEDYAKKAQQGYTVMTEDVFNSHTDGFNTPNGAWMFALTFKDNDDNILQNDADGSWGSQMIIEVSPSECGYAANYGQPKRIDRHLFETIPATDFRKKGFIDFAIAESFEKAAGDTLGALRKLEAYTDDPEGILTTAEATTSGTVGGLELKFRPKGGEHANQYKAFTVAVPLMRVEEMKLIEAEAAGMQDEARGIALLTAFAKTRDPQYVYGKHSAETYGSTYAKPFQNEVWWQRRVELWGEGFAFYDIKRLDKQVIRSYAGSNHIELYRWNADVYNKVEGTNYPDWMTLCFPQTQTNYSNIEPNPIPVAPTATSPEHEW